MTTTIKIDGVDRPVVDAKSFELAEFFLCDLEGDEATEDQKWQLAAAIQDAVEEWFKGEAMPEEGR